MMELLRDVILRCSCCGEDVRIPKDLEMNISSYDHGENAMGIETQYSFEDRFLCPACHKQHIYIRIEGSEYPEGAFNSSDSYCDGGVFLEEPELGIIYDYCEFNPLPAENGLFAIQNLIKQIANDRSLIYDISPRRFEEIVARIFLDNGYGVELTQATRDGGKDIILTKYEMGSPTVYYVECKRYGKRKKIGVEIVRAMYGVQESDRVNKSILVTTSTFSPEAKKFAEDQNTRIALLDIDDLYELIQKSAEHYRYR